MNNDVYKALASLYRQATADSPNLKYEWFEGNVFAALLTSHTAAQFFQTLCSDLGITPNTNGDVDAILRMTPNQITECRDHSRVLSYHVKQKVYTKGQIQ
jgi:hypothetical protein